MSANLETVRSLLWMLRKLKEQGRFLYNDWAEEFRPEDPPMATRNDRRFLNHVAVLRDQILPIFQSGRPDDDFLKAEKGVYSTKHAIGQGEWAKVPDAEGLNFLPLLNAINQSQSLMPFPSPRILKLLATELEVKEERLNPVVFKNTVSWKVDYRWIREVLDAVEARERLYVEPQPPRKPCEVTPLFLVNCDGAWYLLALSGTLLLQYNLSRVQKLTRRKGVEAEKLPATTYRTLRNQVTELWGTYWITDPFEPEPGEPVTIRYTGSARQYATERFEQKSYTPGTPWFRISVQEEWADVTLRVQSHGARYSEILGEILRWGPLARPLAPPELVRQWKESIQTMAKALEQDGNF
ncbi:MAG: WYL domain-containing protein [Spirochaetales bacterium]|nr:WYL domain-containing protein [Spirochaetales bacterium]